MPSHNPDRNRTGPHAPARPDDPTGTATGPAPPARIGRYEVRQVLGEGAFGRVYRGFDPELHRNVAIKVPHPHVLNAGFRERFVREARATATIHHPNVCPIHDVGTAGDVPYIVMHFVHGGTLSGLLERRKGPFPPRQAAAIARKLALGVAAAHAKGVIHRDLKPQNALWDEANREVLVTDFGLARLAGEAQLSRTGDILGTPAYMAPEQARGLQAEVGPLSDVYSLGVILYRLLTGELPFQGSTLEVLAQAQFTDPRPPSQVLPGLGPALDAICLKAMAKAAADRPPSARAFADALTQTLGLTGAELWELSDLGGGAAGEPARSPSPLPAPPRSGAAAPTHGGPSGTTATRIGGGSYRSRTRAAPTDSAAQSFEATPAADVPRRQRRGWGSWLLIRFGVLAGLAAAVAAVDPKLVLPVLLIAAIGYVAIHFALANADE